MQLHPVSQIQADPEKRGEFYVNLKLAKGYRYRYLFFIDGSEVVDDTTNLKSVRTDGKLTNYIELAKESQEQMTVQEFISNLDEETKGGEDAFA